MSNSSYQIVNADQSTAITNLGNAAQQAQAALNTLNSDIQAIMSQYKGLQANAFATTYNSIETNVTKATKQISQMQSLVDSSTKTYNSNDSQVASSYQKVGSQVDSEIAANPVLSRLSG